MGATYTLGCYYPPVSMSLSDDQKAIANVNITDISVISEITLFNEIVRVNVEYDETEAGYPATTTFRWYNVDTGALLFTYIYAPPEEAIEAAWSWIGHLLTGEIYTAGNYKVVISAPGYPDHTENFKIVHQDIVPPNFYVSQWSASPLTLVMPGSIGLKFWVVNGLTTSVTCDIGAFLISPAGASVAAGKIHNITFKSKELKTIDLGGSFTNLASGSYDVFLIFFMPGKFTMLGGIKFLDAISVVGLVIPPTPFIEDGTVIPSSAAVGSTVTIIAVLKNIGTEPADWSWNFEIAGFGGVHKPIHLEPGQTKEDTQPFVIPAALPFGMYAVSIYLADIYRTFGEQLSVIETEPTGWLAQAKKFILETLPSWLISIPKALSDIFSNATQIANIIAMLIPNALQAAKDYVISELNKIYDYFPAWLKDLINWLNQVEKDVINWLITTGKDMLNDLQGWWDQVVNYVGQEYEALKGWATEQWNSLKNWIEDLETAISNFGVFVREKFDEWWLVAKETIEFIIPQWVYDVYHWYVDVALPAVNDFITNFPDLYNNFIYFMFHPWEKVKEGINYLLDKQTEDEEDIEKEWQTKRDSFEE